MKQDLVFPYCVPYPRTGNWYCVWRELSSWMTDNFGKCAVNWEYMDEKFWFKTAEDKTLFLLRWK
jgi:hypothetical protein